MSAQHLGSPGVPNLLEDEDVDRATAPQLQQPRGHDGSAGAQVRSASCLARKHPFQQLRVPSHDAQKSRRVCHRGSQTFRGRVRRWRTRRRETTEGRSSEEEKYTHA